MSVALWAVCACIYAGASARWFSQRQPFIAGSAAAASAAFLIMVAHEVFK